MTEKEFRALMKVAGLRVAKDDGGAVHEWSDEPRLFGVKYLDDDNEEGYWATYLFRKNTGELYVWRPRAKDWKKMKEPK